MKKTVQVLAVLAQVGNWEPRGRSVRLEDARIMRLLALLPQAFEEMAEAGRVAQGVIDTQTELVEAQARMLARATAKIAELNAQLEALRGYRCCE